jgi:hypothetical protein
MTALGVNINGNTEVQKTEENPGIDNICQSEVHKNENYGNGDNIDGGEHKGMQTRKAPTFSAKEILKNPALARLLVLASKKVKAENLKKEQI